MKSITKWLAVLLLTLAVLAGCSGKKEVHKVNFITSPAYEAEEIPLPVQTGDLLGCCTDGETMFILIDEKVGEEVKTSLSRVSLTDGTAENLSAFVPAEIAGTGGKNTLGPILAPDGSLWLYEMWTINYYDLPEDFDPEKETMGQYLTGHDDFHHLRQLDPKTGNEKKIIDLSDAVRTLEVDNIFDVAGVAVDGKGNFYFAATGGVGVLDKNMNYLCTLEADIPRPNVYSTSGGPLAVLPDGSVAVLTIQPGGKRLVRTIDPAAKDWGEAEYLISGSTDLLYGGSNGFLFYYTMGGALFAWEPDAVEGRLLLNWSDTGLSGSAACFAPLDEGKMAALTLSYENGFDWYKGEIRMSMLLPTDKSPTDGKIKLVYGTIGSDAVQRQRVAKFNKVSEDYYIELRNYAGEGMDTWDMTSEQRDAAKKLLAAEVVSGKAPDIWDTSLPISLYARKGVLEDLWPFIDSDPEISRDMLMSHVLDCASIDGKLYQVFNTFGINTGVANAALVGNRTSWTLEEMMEFYESMPEGSSIAGPDAGQIPVLSILIGDDLGHWIDWNTGECRFNSEEFKRILEVSRGVEDVTWETRDLEKVNLAENGVYLREGRQMIKTCYLNGINDMLYYDVMLGGPEHLTNYIQYLYDNNFYAPGDPVPNEDAIPAHIINTAAIVDGMFHGYMPVTENAVIGAPEGGGYAAFIGTPTDGGSGSTFMFPSGTCSGISSTMAVSAACESKEGAWQFVRQLLLPSSTNDMTIDGKTYISDHFPICKENFDNSLEPQWYTDNAGNIVLDRDGNKIERPVDAISIPQFGFDNETASMVFLQMSPTEEQMENFWNLYNSISTVDTYNSNYDIIDLITEQAQPYFAGDKSLDETANLINRRVSLYVNENR